MSNCFILFPKLHSTTIWNLFILNVIVKLTYLTSGLGQALDKVFSGLLKLFYSLPLKSNLAFQTTAYYAEVCSFPIFSPQFANLQNNQWPQYLLWFFLESCDYYHCF